MTFLPYSVVIPAFNATRFLPETLSSVFAQTVPPAQVIVVDDGSTDDVTGCLDQLRHHVTLIRQPNGGPGSATTQGMHFAAGPLIATLDADDLWMPDKMERQLDFMAQNPQTDIVFARMTAFNDADRNRWVDDAKSGWARSTMVVTKDAFLRVGPMVDQPGRLGEMIDWIDRARYAGLTMQMLETPLARRRLHTASLTHTRTTESTRAYLEVARRAIQRRKGVSSDV